MPDAGYYETQDGLSWGVNPMYSHDWNEGESEIRLQISRRETPTLPTERRAQIYQSYFRFLPFAPTDLTCLALAEILAEKIRACYQRNNARDIYDLGIFATRPLDHALIRRLVVLKLWQARDTFDPARLMRKFEDGGISTGKISASFCAVPSLLTVTESPPTASGDSDFSRSSQTM